MRLSAFETYKKYLAVRRHFTSSYNYFKYNGKINANLESFKDKSDKYNFQKLSRLYDDNDLLDFLVAIFCFSTIKWSGDLFSSDNDRIYKGYIKRKQALLYTFQSDLAKIGTLDNIFKSEESLPKILEMYLSEDITLETLILLDTVIGFKAKYDQDSERINDFLWPNISNKMGKLKPFMTYDQSKILQILIDHKNST